MACDALLAADVASMLEQRIKQPDSTLASFESAAAIVAVVANGSPQAQRVLNRLGLMGHLVGILTDSSAAAAPARLAAVRAVAALCSTTAQSVVDFFYYNGVNTVLQTLFQSERTPAETLASVQLLEHVLAHTEECRNLMKEVGGIEVLAQVHREAETKGAADLQQAALNTLAILTYSHAENMANLESASRLLGCEDLAMRVARLHATDGAHRSPPRAVAGVSGLSASLSRSLRTSDTSASDVGEGPVTPPALGGGRGRLSSDLGQPRQSMRALGSSVKSMFGSIKRYMSKDSRSMTSPRLSRRSPSRGDEAHMGSAKATEADIDWFAM